MPVTPFHFGIGLLGKGLAPNQVSFSSFVASQVLIDCESAYYLFIAPAWPVHRWAHTLLVAVPLGVAVGLAVWGLGRAFNRIDAPPHELGLWPALAGGLLGGATHPLLDALMHPDAQLFMPFRAGNPLLGMVSLAALHLACVGAALLGGSLLWLRAPRASVAPDQRG